MISTAIYLQHRVALFPSGYGMRRGPIKTAFYNIMTKLSECDVILADKGRASCAPIVVQHIWTMDLNRYRDPSPGFSCLAKRLNYRKGCELAI